MSSPTLTILPAAAVMFSGLPTTFILSGGTGAYIVTSSNQAVLPISGGQSNRSVTLVPNPVAADTTVTLTVRDTGTATPVSATVTVKPGTVNNEFTITPTSTQGSNCSPAICSGGDATVSVRLSQGGIPLAARGVRFDVVSGDYRFIITSPGTGVETLETSATVLTDETGKASARIRVTPAAPNQTALLKVTDLGTSAFQQTSFVIAQATGASPGFFAIPDNVTFTGPNNTRCAQGASSTFFIYGGTPPYAIANTSTAFAVSPTVVSARGGSFTVTAQGTCVDPGLPIGITDAASRTLTVTVANKLGTAELPALVVAPETISLSDCNGVASFTVAGGTGNYLQPSAGSGSIQATISGNTVSVFRLNPSAATSSPVSIGISDGVSAKSVTLTLTGKALGACPSAGLSANPAVVTLTDCSTSASVVISNSTGTLSAVSSSSSILASVSGTTVNIRRADPSAAFAGGTVTVSDASGSVVITVNATGAGAGACTGTGGPPSSIVANPNNVSLADCNSTPTVILSGGVGAYSAFSSSAGISATVSGSVLTIRRVNPSAATGSGTVTITDGASSTTIAVSTSGNGAGICPTPTTPTPLVANPTTVNLSDCNATPSVLLSGGTGTYSAVSSTAGITATVNSNVLTIRRSNPSAATAGGTVIVTDGTSSTTITVTASGNGAGICPTPATPGALTANPTGVNLADCGATPSVLISGGTGTYTAVSSNTSISGTVSGNLLTIRRTSPSAATTGGTVTVTDGTSSVTVTVAVSGNGAGICPTPTTPTPLAASTTSVSLTDCGSTPSVLLSGGSGTYTAASSNSSIVATVSGNVLVIRRASPSGAVTGGTVTATDGSSSVTITVTASGTGAGACPAPTTPSAIVVSPATVNLSDCGSTPAVLLSGGAGAYSAASSNTSITATVTGNILTIRRANPSGATTGATITVSDGASSALVGATTSGGGGGICPTPTPTPVITTVPTPATVTLTACTDEATVALGGGNGVFSATSNTTSVVAVVNGSNLVIRRANPSAAVAGGTVAVTSGTSSVAVVVNLTGNGAAACPTGGALVPLAVNPGTVTLSDCSTTQNVVISNGSGGYRVFSNNSSINADLAAGTTNVVRISRKSGTGAVASPQSATVFDATLQTPVPAPVDISILLSGAGAAACP